MKEINLRGHRPGPANKQFEITSDYFTTDEYCNNILVKAYADGEIYEIYDLMADVYRDLADFPANEQAKMIEWATNND